MLRDQVEVEIMASAKLPALRDARDNSVPAYTAMVEDFGLAERFAGHSLLELGPGHYEFAEIARDAGATVVGADFDPAVVSLGEHRGFEAVECDFRTISPEMFAAQFDALFCRRSFNAFWFYRDDERQRSWIASLRKLFTPSGWALLLPYNHPGRLDLDEGREEEVLQAQADAFSKCGFDRYEISDPAHLGRYGLSHAGTLRVFACNLPVPEAFTTCLAQAAGTSGG